MTLEYLAMFWQYGIAYKGIELYNKAKKAGYRTIYVMDPFYILKETIHETSTFLDAGANI